MLQILERELLTLDQSQNTARSAHDDVGTVVLQNLLILGNGHASKEHSDLQIEHMSNLYIYIKSMSN